MALVANIKGPSGSVGPVQTLTVPILLPNATASAAATNLAASTFSAVSDMNLRHFADLRGMTKCRVTGRVGGSLVAATKIRVQYHIGGNIAVASGDAGWTTLATTAGSHALNTLFRSGEIVVPSGSQIQDCIVRAGLFDGNGVADPTITCCIIDFYQ